MTWIQTASGLAVDLLKPRPEQIKLGDIAVSLSRLNRFNGHTKPLPYSVAQHSCLVADLVAFSGVDADPQFTLAALLHDAHEFALGYLVSPVKQALDTISSNGFGNWWRMIEAPLQQAIHEALALPRTLPPAWIDAIKLADLQALEIERRAYMQPCVRPWGSLPEPPAGWEAAAPLSAIAAEREFIKMALFCLHHRHGVAPSQEAA